MTTEEDLVVELLASVEDDLPVDPESRARVRATTLTAFDEATAGEIADRSEPGEMPNLVVAEPPGLQTEGRAGRSYQLMAAAAVVILGIGVTFFVRDFLESDSVSISAEDEKDIEAGGRDGRSVSGSDLLEGLEFELPLDVELVSSSPGQMMFIDTSASNEVGIAAVRVTSWGEALAVDSVPFSGEVSSLGDWLAKSSTDQSDLRFSEVNANGARVEAWSVRLTGSAAAAVGCERVGPCGVVAVGPEGQTVALAGGDVTELISVEIGELSTLIVFASYAEEEATDELVAAELARSIASADE